MTTNPPLVPMLLAALLGGPLAAQTNRSEPGPISDHKMAYDPIGHRTLVYSGVGPDGYRSELWASTPAGWTLLSTGGPTGRDDAQLAFDSDRGRLVLYGGRRFGRSRDELTLLTDTWEWDGTAWQLIDSVGAGPRGHAGMAYDTDRRVTVLFGGFGREEGAVLADTWEWNGRAWHRRADGPPRRWVNALVMSRRGLLLHAAVMDQYDQRSSLAPGELWRWDGQAWARVDSAPALSPQGPVTPFGDGILVYAGWVPDTPARTWLWNKAGWAEITGDQPPRRRNGAMAFDPERNRVILLGGATDRDRLADRWEFDGRRWQRSP